MPARFTGTLDNSPDRDCLEDRLRDGRPADEIAVNKTSASAPTGARWGAVHQRSVAPSRLSIPGPA